MTVVGASLSSRLIDASSLLHRLDEIIQRRIAPELRAVVLVALRHRADTSGEFQNVQT